MKEIMKEIIEVRRNIGDPVTTDFVVVDDLPANPLPDTAYTLGDGTYQYFDNEWRLYYLKFSDNYIRQLVESRGVYKASIKLIDNLIARLDPTDYMVSGSTGGQSMTFTSISEALEFYNRLRDNLLLQEAEEEGTNSGLMLSTKKKMIGGVIEYE